MSIIATEAWRVDPTWAIVCGIGRDLIPVDEAMPSGQIKNVGLNNTFLGQFTCWYYLYTYLPSQITAMTTDFEDYLLGCNTPSPNRLWWSENLVGFVTILTF